MKKMFVGVTTEWTAEGKIIPTIIKWEDGRRFAVDRVLDVRPAASLKVGGAGNQVYDPRPGKGNVPVPRAVPVVR